MIPRKVAIPSVYDEKQFKKAGLRFNPFDLTWALVLLLVAIRFMNLALGWWVSYLELSHKPPNKEITYTFLHFSNYQKAKEKCLELSQKPSAAPVTVTAYFNLLQPAVFLVRNQAKFAAVDLGRMVVPLTPGLFTFTLYLSDLVEKQWDHNTQQAHWGDSLGRALLAPKSQDADDLSFIMKPLEKSAYLKIPYLVYFYLPLVLIFLLAGFYSRAVWTSFFYYIGLFLLFDFRKLLFAVPLGGVNHLFKIKDPASGEVIGAAVVVLLFTALGIIGLFHWRKTRDLFKERLMVFFFILLPLFLRF
jgi:hypothetical protein